jgi:hypothetical protein
MKTVLCGAGITWKGWHGFRRGLASNLNRLGVDDSIIQSILRHSTVTTTQNHYIKTVRPDAVAAMRRLSDALVCSGCAPELDTKSRALSQSARAQFFPTNRVSGGGRSHVRTPTCHGRGVIALLRRRGPDA